MAKITVKDTEINITKINDEDYICITDMLKAKDGDLSIVYADEADVLNVALFGKTAKKWREENLNLKGNIRDYASMNELICLSNLENINAVLINEQVPQKERLIKLNQIAIYQISILQQTDNRKLLK